MTDKVAIIGAGLAGLSAGIYLQKEGIATEIFELAPWAGGVCTTWVRQGYRFDGCIHWMVGTKPGNDFYDLYREVDALEENTVIYNAASIRQEINGVLYDIPLRLPEFTVFLHQVAPQDGKIIDSFCGEIKKMMESKMVSKAPSNLSGMIKFMRESTGYMSVMAKYARKTVGDYLKSVQSPTLRALIVSLMPAEYSMSGLLMMLCERMNGNAGYPMGGALEMIQRMEAKYRSLGGEIHFQSRVEKIVVENGTATSIVAKGQTFPVASVIVASDAYDALHTLLGGQYKHPQLDEMLKSARLFDPLILISFGLDRRFDIPFAVSYEIPEGIEVAQGLIKHEVNLRSFEFDTASAPENCSSVMALFEAPLDYWNDLRTNDLEEYKNQKQKLAESVIRSIDKRIPGFQKAVKVIDVATPATYVHLVNLYQASYEGFAPTPEMVMTNIRKNIPGIKNLTLCGQWTVPGGGICSAINSGKEAAEATLKVLGKK